MVSVIVPNYNHENHLANRLNSILNQSYSKIEIILLDDCSSDNSLNLIKGYQHHALVKKVIINDQNSGSTFLQWEKGFSCSESTYIWIAESDDVADLSFLSEMIPLLEQDPNIQLAFCANQVIDEEGRIIGETVWDHCVNKAKPLEMDGVQFCADFLLKSPVINNASGVVFRRSALENVSNDYKQYKFCGDWQFWADIALQGSIAYHPKKLNSFRRSVTQLTGEKMDDLAANQYHTEVLKVGSHIINQLKQKKDINKAIEYARTYQFYIWTSWYRGQLRFGYKEFIYVYKTLFSLTRITPLLFIGVQWRCLVLFLRKKLGLKNVYEN